MKARKVSPASRSWSSIDHGEHHFCVEIPNTKTGEVVITENFVAQDPDLPPVVGDSVKPRVVMSKAKWDHIAAAARVEFNERSKKAGFGVSSLQAGPNKLPRSYGKEIVLLAWAIEQAPEEKIADAVQNWLGLSPEERWWLYTQANAATGHAVMGRGKGWRKAIQIALTENPVSPNDDASSDMRSEAKSSRPRSTADLKKTLTIG